MSEYSELKELIEQGFKKVNEDMQGIKEDIQNLSTEVGEVKKTLYAFQGSDTNEFDSLKEFREEHSGQLHDIHEALTSIKSDTNTIKKSIEYQDETNEKLFGKIGNLQNKVSHLNKH